MPVIPLTIAFMLDFEVKFLSYVVTAMKGMVLGGELFLHILRAP